jgi:FkbM family methyltransferase
MQLCVTVEKARRVLGPAVPLYQLAENLSERVSITLFITRLLFARLARGNFLRILFQHEDATIRLGGMKYVLGIKTMEYGTVAEVCYHRVYDQVADFIPRFGWTVFDIGANIGAFALQQALRGAHVYAFEPNPSCYRRMSRAVSANKLANKISTFDYAIGSGIGLGMIIVKDMFTNMGSITPIIGSTPIDCPEVSITSLDLLVPSLRIECIDLVKIDVEGYEAEVLKGASSTLRIVKRIILEYHSRDLLEEVEAFLCANGFSNVLQVDYRPPPGYTAMGLLYYAKPSISCD